MNHQAHQEHQAIELLEPPKEVDQIAKIIVDSAYTVHKELGPGLLESAYEACLLEELQDRKVNVRSQVPLKIKYKSKFVDAAYRLDLVVENSVLVELKSVEKLSPLHEAQILSYLKLSRYRLGFLINFNSRLIKDGIKRFAL